jgi:uncharacterized protein (DUF305 family)
MRRWFRTRMVAAALVMVAAMAGGCAGPAADRPPAGANVAADATDVWFMQHLVPHLRQTVAVVALSEGRIIHPELARLADATRRRSQGHLQLLQAWLDRRGLAPHGHSHQAVDQQPRSDLERLARVPDDRFDRAFATVLAARQRVSDQLAAAELRHGSLPEVRELARQLQAEHRRQLRQLTAWRNAWSRTPRRLGPT